MEAELQPFLYLLYLLNGGVGLLLGLFLYREYHEGFMVLIRERVFSLKWVVVPLLLIASLLNIVWFYKIRQLDQDLILLLLIFSGMVVPFLWMAVLTAGRFLLLDVLMGFLGEVSESFSAIRQDLQQWLQKRDIQEQHQHEDMMDRIRKVRRQWAEKRISRKDAVDKISKLKKKSGGSKAKKKTAASAGRKRKSTKKAESEMSTLMSGFIDRVMDEKENK